ncbi:MAG: pilus assembly protein TadG-related protein [Pseudomonadota bacterium]
MFRKNGPVSARFLREQKGAVAIWFALCLLVFVPLMALAIDMPYGMFERARLQTAASSSALAAVTDLVDEDEDGTADDLTYVEAGVALAYKSVGEGYGAILGDCGTYNFGTDTVVSAKACADIVPGHWDNVLGTFSATLTEGQELNAVQVITHRGNSVSNPLATFLAGAVGLEDLEINTSAVAWAAPAPANNCILDGLSAGHTLSMEQKNHYLRGVCLYGRQHIHEGKDNLYDHENGTEIYLGESATVTPSNMSSSLSDGWDEALQDERVDQTLLVDEMDAIVAHYASAINLQQVDLNNVPSVSGEGEPAAIFEGDKLPDPGSGGYLQEGTFYEIEGTAEIKQNHMNGDPIQGVVIKAEKITVDSNTVLNNVVFYATDEFSVPDPVVDIGSDVVMDNMLILSNGQFNFQSNGTIGAGNCDSTEVSVIIIAQGELKIESDNTISNMIILGGLNVDQKGVQVQGNAHVFLSQPTGANGELFPSNDPTSDPPSLVRPTIQALNTLSIQSDGTFEACPASGGGGGSEDLSGVVYRLVE